MQNCIIPTDNLGKGADRQSIKAINQHLKNGGALTLFPAGSVSRVYDGKIQDKRWNNAYIKLAEKHQCAIVPVYFEAKNSAWFYLLSKLSFPLSTLWLVRELFNYKNKTINAYIGPSIQPETLFQQDQSTDQLSQFVRNKVYSLAK
jgi:putative hemolysin